MRSESRSGTRIRHAPRHPACNKQTALTLSWDAAFTSQLDHLAKLNHTSRNAIIIRAIRALISALHPGD